MCRALVTKSLAFFFWIRLQITLHPSFITLHRKALLL